MSPLTDVDIPETAPPKPPSSITIQALCELYTGPKTVRELCHTLNRTCRVCRCTDAEPCRAGCAWINPYADLCTTCDALAEALVDWLDSIITIAAADSPISPAYPGARCSRCLRVLRDDETLVIAEWKDVMFGYCRDCAGSFCK